MADGFVVSAPATGSGKTVVTLGLLELLRRRGLSVRSAKVGPDYIDPRFHEAVTGTACTNLDGWAMRPCLINHLIAQSAAEEMLVVEGVMGMFDGAPDGKGSTAHIAVLAGLPVVLVIDCRPMAQSIRAIVMGFARLRPEVQVAGLILNRVASPRHERMLRRALEGAEAPVIGVVASSPDLALPSRHLGLVQARELADIRRLVERVADHMAPTVDLDAVAKLARPARKMAPDVPLLAPLGQRIAVADDEAFAFAYPHMLAGWRAAGAEILPFSPLAGDGPAGDADAIFLPGGYPELHGGRIAANQAFRDGLHAAAARGALVYGECGGYMALGDGLIDAEGCHHAMAGLLPVVTSFAKRRLTLGYRRLTQRNVLPWAGGLRGHEFHYSTVESQGGAEPLFEAFDAEGTALGSIGLRRGRVMGSYAHVIDQEG